MMMASPDNEADSSSSPNPSFDTLNNKDNFVTDQDHSDPFPVKNKDRPEDELDFEEGSVGSVEKVDCPDQEVLETEVKPPTDDKDLDEGQVNSDDDLEEGEVKDDDDDEPVNGPKEKEPCRFFGKGQCTWGDSCRFSHDLTSPTKSASANSTPMGPLPQKIPFEPLPLPPLPLYPHPALLPPPPHIPRSAIQESGWERGIKTARERIVRANERKEKDVDFNEKRLNMSVEDDDGYRPPKHHYASREDYHSSHDRRSPHGYPPSSSSLYSKYAEQYYSESSRSSRYQDAPPPREERYVRERKPTERDRESEYERRQRLALESAPKEWREDRRGQYDHGRPSGRIPPEPRRPDDYVDPYRRSPVPRSSAHHDNNRSPYSSFTDTSGSGLSGSSEFSGSDSDSFSDHGEPKERAKKRKDYKTKSYSSAAVPRPIPGALPNPPSKRIPKISQRGRPEEAPVAPNHPPPRSNYQYDDRSNDRYEPERDRRYRDGGDPYARSRSRSHKGNSVSPDEERPTRVSRDEDDAPYRKKKRSGQSPHDLAPAPKEPSFTMNVKGKSRPNLSSKPFDSDDDDRRNMISPKDDNSLSPGFDQMSPKHQIAHLSAKSDPSQRRKDLLAQLHAVEAAIAKKKKT